MYLKSILILFLFSLSFSLIAQKEANIWYFGEFAGIDFNSGAPVVLNDGQLDTNEGCATISDHDGNLLFYTDGINVFNKNHTLMPNTGLIGHSSSTHSGIIVPYPGNQDKYFIFTVDAYSTITGGGPLAYSEVDMNLDGGLGDITANKNIILQNSVNEKVTAIEKSTEDGYWVVSHIFNSDEFVVYEVTATGVNPVALTTSVGSQTGYFNVSGQIKISPDNSKLAVARGGEVQLFDFNNTSGAITNPQTINNGTYGSYGIEFSAGGDLLYVAYYGGVSQYNLQAGTLADIIASEVVLISVPSRGFASMQIAPDGRIYVARQNLQYIDFIESPNVIGLGCNYNYEGLFLNGGESNLGLPTFIQSFFSANILFDNNCLGEATTFSVSANQNIDTILWDFGDGNTSILENPIHSYTTSGTFNVIVIVTSGGNSTTKTRQITIFDSPIINSPITLSQCDDNLDGYSAFNLNEAINEITTNAVNETISFYESQLDAENNNNPISNTLAYVNQNVSTDIVWARVENNNGCFKTAQVNLVVSTTQIPLTFTRDFYTCDDIVDGDTTNGISSFNFSSVTTEIEALYPVGQQLIITYYRNLSDALAETNTITNIADYRNVGYPNIQDIYIRVDSLLDNDCLGLGQHITLHVETVPVANPVAISEACDDDGDGIYAFDTSNIESTLLNGQNNVIVAYTDENGTPLPSPLPNPFTTVTQTITARVTYTISQDPNGPCFDETTIDFNVDAVAIAYPVPDVRVCDDNNDGLYAFDTSTFEATILNGQTGMQVTYTDEDGSALASPLPNPFISASQTITVRVENTLSATCFDETTVNLIVYQQPIVHTIQDDFVCDVDADGSHDFVLTDYNPQVLNGQSNTVFEVVYFDNLTNAENNVSPLPSNYVSNSTSETIYARIHNRNNSDCYAITSFQIGVSYMPIAYQPEDMNVCDDGNNDGVAEFDLSNQNDAILNGQSEIENIISFYLSQEDADDNTNGLSTTFTNSETPQTIYVRLENSNNIQCYATTSFNIMVVEKPVLLMDEQWPICEGGTVEITADAGYDEYLWSTGETTQSIIVDATGTYEVIARYIYGNLSCEDSMTITVVQSDIAIITNIDTIDWSQDNNEIIVTISGNGDYEYSIDGVYYQNSSHFTNLNAGEYVVYVRDKNGCGITVQEVYLMYYPKFFTPNKDGYNDNWQLYGSKNEPKNIIYIYDRFGKLLKQLNPTDRGWDGTFNGSKLPTSDYWFVLKRQNGKQYRGHFTLKN